MVRSSPQLAALLWDVDGTLAETERDGHRVAYNRGVAYLSCKKLSSWVLQCRKN